VNPIRPENRHLYPPNWEDIRERVLARAGNCCENCEVPNHAIGFRDGAGAFMTLTADQEDELELKTESDTPNAVTDEYGIERKVFKVVLTVAHLNHNPSDCDDGNLKAWCQKCHNSYDAVHRHANRRRRLAEESGQIDLI
jgi:hypothetical protein